jgi:hypothetical protein
MTRVRLLSLVVVLLALVAMCSAAPAEAAFGLKSFDVTFVNRNGEPVTQAGTHPYAMTLALFANTKTTKAGEFPDGSTRDLEIEQIPGFAGNPTAVPPCPGLDFLTPNPKSSSLPECADSAAVGIVEVNVGIGEGHGTFKSPVYLLEPAPGVVARLGFWVQGVPVVVAVGVSESPPFNVVAHTRGVSQVLEFFGAELTLWGNPASSGHNEERGSCYQGSSTDEVDDPDCEPGVGEKPFLTLPRACTGAVYTKYAADSWQNPGTFFPNGEPNLTDPAWVTGEAQTPTVAEPAGFTSCGKLSFSPQMSAQPSTTAAESSAGIDVVIDAPNPGLSSAKEGVTTASDIRSVTVAFPPGVTLNPAAAEGLGACSLAQYESASLTVQGCPDSAKIGSIEVETPILENKVIRGSVYLAEQGAGNPFGSLFAVYLLIRNPGLGIFVKQAGKGETNEATGQVTTSFEDIPQFPLSRIAVHLRSGPRAPLVTPPTCGTYGTTATITPWSGTAPVIETSTFKVSSGPNGGPCPSTGVPPFTPGFEAGTVDNAAGNYSPFLMRVTRSDGQQDLTRFSATLPPGVVAKIAGVAQCSDAQIAEAKAKSGRAELASPSCPASSQVGRVIAGAGVGSDLTYVPGSVYLAGPYGGDPLSVVAIVPAVAGPFDVGTVVTREALTLNPTTYRAEVDGAASDPIPHMLKGIPLKLRELQIAVDRPDFTLNATSCEEEETLATLVGSGADPFSIADDSPLQAGDRYQASSCASLDFKPKLDISLVGGTKRGDHPALHSTLVPRKGDANIGRAVVTLPKSEFIDNAHINNPCTRVQFNADACPKNSVLGTAKAISPLLDEPLTGPVYFRTNGGERNLPDIVADLHGAFHIVLVGFVDSKKGRIRTTFATAPDAPVKKFTLDLYGGRKGLLVNSADLCAHRRHVRLSLTGQNGRTQRTNPLLKTSCAKKRKRGRQKGAR